MKTEREVKPVKLTPYNLGFLDGFEQGDNFYSGLTWSNNHQANISYDVGVNEGQIARKKVNSHDELIKSLQAFLDISYSTEDSNYDEVEKAIEQGHETLAKAEGGKS